MCAKSHNKKLFSSLDLFLKLKVFAFLGIFFCVETCYTAEGEEGEISEKVSLVKNLRKRQHDHDIIDIATTGHIQDEKIFAMVEKTEYDPNSLILADHSMAQEQISIIVTFIDLSTKNYTRNNTSFSKIKQKYQGYADRDGTSIETPEDLLNYLKPKARKAIAENPTIMMYLKERREQNEKLVNLVKELLREIELLREQNYQSLLKIGSLQNQYLLFLDPSNFQRYEPPLVEPDKIESSQNSNNCQTYIIPMLSFVLGMSMTAVGFLAYYYASHQ